MQSMLRGPSTCPPPELAAHIEQDLKALQKDNLRIRDVLISTASPRGYCIVASTGPDSGATPVFCGQCSPYELGYSIAMSQPHVLEQMLSTYLEHLVPTFVSDACDALITDSPWLSTLLPVIAQWLVHLAEKERQRSEGLLARHCCRMAGEIRGLRDGYTAYVGGPYTSDALEARLWAVNLAPDLLTVLLNSGQLHSSLMLFLATSTAKRLQLGELLSAFIRKSAPMAQTLDELMATGMGLGCDAFAVRCQEQGRVSFGRDFQLPNGRVFQRAACIRILHVDAGCVFQSGAVGLCSGVTNVRVCARTGDHACIGVNMFRAQWQNGSTADLLQRLQPVGVPSLGVLSAVAFDYGGPLRSAAIARYISNLPHASAWIYPIATARDAGVAETVGRHLLSRTSAVAVALAGVDCATTRALLTPDALGGEGKHCWYANGTAFRAFGFETPEALRRLNYELFQARAPVTEAVDATRLCAEMLHLGLLHPPSWVGTNYFPLTGRSGNVLVASNNAVVPLLRAFQMRRAPDRATALTSKGIEWRYVQLLKRATALSTKACICLQDVIDTISFLDPHKSKYWWPKRPAPGSHPRDMDVQGALNVVWAGRRAEDLIFGHKSGTWGTPWVSLRCAAYLHRGVRR